MLDAVAEQARAAGLDQIIGYFFPTKKNGMVARHYESAGLSAHYHRRQRRLRVIAQSA